MDKDISSVGTQYIICECGDNFPNEKFLNIHLANNHGEVESFLCDECPEAFTSNNSLSYHKRSHEKTKQAPGRPETIKTYTRKTPQKKEPVVKKPPVLKLKNLKRIDSISLIENLKSLGGIIKIEHTPSAPDPVPEPEPDPEPEVPVLEETDEGQVVVKNEAMEEAEEIYYQCDVVRSLWHLIFGPGPEPETPVLEETDEGQVVVKNEAMEEAEEIYYQCDVCNSIFYTEWEFNIHYQSKHALKLEPSSSAELILEQHLVSDHGVEGIKTEADTEDTAYYYECELCHKIFASEKYFNVHYHKTHSGGLLPVTEEDAVQEQAQEEPAPAPETKPKAPEQVIYYKCDLCKILYPSEKAYNLHFDKKHGGQSCQDARTTGFQLLEQELAENCGATEPLEVFSCEFCPKTYTMKRSIQLHRKRVHGAELRSHAEQNRAANRSKVCDVCGRAYNSNAALRYHQRRHTGEKPYACTICPKRFTMPMFLQIHTRTHTGEKPYECPHCPKAFTNKAALIRHDRVHTGVKPYQCPECGKFFTQSNSMKLHVSTVHLKLPAPYKSQSRRHRSEARARQRALKDPGQEGELVLGD
ncbi:zinc finger protein 658B-like isoform X2 [Cydia splendana]|uniref:zinc finger protein 658B-like isoform X2 n=1 Tax=Cydia splendana TaxID=1100963 RepID=UPI00300D2BEA